MKKLLLTIVCFGLAFGAAAQDGKDSKTDKVKIKPYGFVRNYVNFDTRRTYTVVGGEYNMFPYDESWNGTPAQCDAMGVERVDMNAVPHVSLQALTTRFGLDLEGPNVLGATTSGKVEADFGGFGTTNTVLRLRLAFVKLHWANGMGLSQDLLVGQYWHPLSGDIMPDVLGMASGAPFRAHSRTPQLSYTLSRGGLGFTLSALYQLQYMYNGPSFANGVWSSVASTDFAHRALVPEAFVGVQYRGDRIYTQLGSTCQSLKPRTVGYKTVDVDGTPRTIATPVNEWLTTFTPTFYFQYADKGLSLKYRFIYAQNTSHVNQLNGYAVTDVAADGSWEYAPLRAAISYLNAAVGGKYRFNLFMGYMKNLGAGKDLYDFGTAQAARYLIFMKGGEEFTHLNSAWRIAPSISYNLTHFNVGIEYEWTSCTFGDQGRTGKVLLNDNLHMVQNQRVCLLVKYNF